MIIRTLILAGLICLVLLPLTSDAKVDYVSLHEIETQARQPLSVRLNIVEIPKKSQQESQQESQLHFTLLNRNVETVLDYQRINNHMLRLKSPHYVVGKASILVYEFEQNTWRQTHSVDISNLLTLTKIDKLALAQATKIKTKCMLIRQPKETLWSIASRYQDKWRVDVFSAMLAIYQSNLNKFTQQHIGQLIDNAELVCPSGKTIAMMGKKAEMKREFHRLNNISLK
jgi:K+-sensing histidine kinase KdpD